MLQLWNARKENIEHDFSIAAWSLCVMKEVREDVAARINCLHREAIERVIRKLYFYDPRDMDVVINEFWKEFKHWQQKSEKRGLTKGGGYSLKLSEVRHISGMSGTHFRTNQRFHTWVTGPHPKSRALDLARERGETLNISRQASMCTSVEIELRSRPYCTQLPASIFSMATCFSLAC